ncbi:MAG: Ig domain-containing protein [Lachnospiraceae bacterium]|nr:Ig domain-containing protein [Lachnospiraceae bacterium]
MMCLGFATPVMAARQKHITFSYTYFKHPTIAQDSSGQYYISYYNFVQKEAYMDASASDSSILARGVSLAPSPSMLFSSWVETYRDYSDSYNVDVRMETKFSGSYVVFVLVDATKTTVVNGVKSYYYGDAEIIEKQVSSDMTISLPTGSGRFHNARVAEDVESNRSSRVYPGDKYLETKESRYHLIVLEADPGAEVVKAKSLKLDQTKRTMSLGESFQLTPIITPSNAAYQTVSWSSSNTNVVVVDANGLVTCVGPGNAKITAQTIDGSNKKAYCNITGPKAPSSVKVTGPKSIEYWDTAQMTATVSPWNAVNTAVTWSVLKGNGYVDANGLVTCTGAGDIKVQAMTSNGKKGTYTLKGPKAASSVKITGEKNISLGQSIQLYSTVKPDNAIDKTVTWMVEKGNGVVDPNTGVVTCTGAGDIRVRATTVNGKKSTFTLKGPKAPSSVKITGDKNIVLDGTAQLYATVKPDNAINKEVTWSVVKGNGTVDPVTGLVTCHGAGDIKVQAITSNGKKGTYTIKGPKAPSSVKITGEKNIVLDGTVQLSATIKPDNAIYKTVTWSVDKGNGTVDPATGLVTCTGAGDIKVRATTPNGKYGTFTIKGPKVASSVSIKNSSYKLAVGETAQPVATVNPKGVIYSDVTWSTSDPAIATVAPDGTITAIAPGKAIIYATAYNGKVGKCTVTVKE